MNIADYITGSALAAQRQRVERYDRCEHPSGPHPMHKDCPWMAAKTQGAAA